MGISETLYTRLSGYAGLTALVSKRIYPVLLPQGATYPAVVYELNSAERESAFGSDTGITRATYTVSCFSANHDTTKAVAAQVIAALKRYRDSTSGIQDIFMQDEIDDYNFDQQIYICSMDFEVIHGE